MADSAISFLDTEISAKIALSLGVGLLVGLERESASKDVGVRTFAITALLGMLSDMVSPNFALASMVGVFFIISYMNVRSMLVDRTLEITTSAALIVTFVLGVLVGQGHVFTPVAAAILMTMLLAWKAELAAFAHGLLLNEIRSAVILGLLTFVIYPLLPNSYVDPWDLINPKEAWITVIVLAAISFVNYILLKIYSTRGLFYSALLGGFVNSSAAVTELASSIKNPVGGVSPLALPLLLITSVAMFVRNLVILGVFEPPAIAIALIPLMGMTMAGVYFINHMRQKNKRAGLTPTAPLSVSSPVSMRRILNFAVLFVILEAAGTLAQRYLGAAGVLFVSFLGGFVSSASSTAAAAKLASQAKISPGLAGIATVLASISSAFVNLPLVYQITKDRQLTRNLAFTTVGCILSGLVLMALVDWVYSRSGVLP